MNAQVELERPIADGGIRTTNFFNGRLLTGADLRREQTALRELVQRVGQAAGDGVVYGLEVSLPPDGAVNGPTVLVAGGLAVNRRGRTLALPQPTEVALTRKFGDGSTARVFAECQPVQAGTYIAGAGLYLLTIAPVATNEGRAPVGGLNYAGAACSTDAVVEGVQFRLLPLNSFFTASELTDLPRLRNLLAYTCFGAKEKERFIAQPFAAELPAGLVEQLRATLLTDCDVPLAVLHWTASGGVRFVDSWAVRRRLAPRASGDKWLRLTDEPGQKAGEAMFLQFAAELADLGGVPNQLPALVATQHFHYLPPVGVLPLSSAKTDPGVEAITFFQGLTVRDPIFIEGARAESVVRAALSYPPMDLSRHEVIWRYFVRENMQAFDHDTTGTVRPYMIFTNGQMPYQGDAHHDLAHWNYANETSFFV